MGVSKSFDFSGNSLHGTRGWRFLEFPVLVLQAKKLLHPSLTSVILTMHPILKAGSSSQVFFLSCWTFFFIDFLRIFNCRE